MEGVEQEVPIEDHVEEALALRMLLFLALLDHRRDVHPLGLLALRLHLDPVERGETLALDLDLHRHQDLLHQLEKRRQHLRLMMAFQSRGIIEAVNVTIIG